MIKTEYRLSDDILENELISYVKKREMDQKFNYLWKWAEKYYEVAASNADDKNIKWERYRHFFKEKIHIPKSKTFAFISLWCGNALEEKLLLEKLLEDGYMFSYIWVDSSKSMLHLAQKNLSTLWKLDQTFVCADFCDTSFIKNMNKLTKDIDQKVFFFFWRTFGNPNQTNITWSLYNILWKNDYLWFDILWRDWKKSSSKLKIFERYTVYVRSEDRNVFDFIPLSSLWVNISSGKMILRTKNEPSVWAIVYDFSFLFEKKVVIRVDSEIMHFLPGESISLMQIRNYDIEKFLHFLAEYDFLVVASELGKLPGWIIDAQLLLQKKW